MKMIRFRHKEMTDEEAYEEVKKMYRNDKDGIVMDPKTWKKERLKELRRKGLEWSK